MLKLSRYLHLINLDGMVGVVNALSGGVAFVAPEIAGTLVRDDTDLDEMARRFPELMGIGTFVSPDVDERDLVRVRIGQARFGGRSLNLTIVPTLACNMRCSYCDQQEDWRRYAMSAETAAAVVRYVADRIEGRNLLSVTWYGGEPLLAFDRLLALQRALYELCAEHAVAMMSNITTNGTLVTREIVTQLREVGVRQAQVTLDGPQRIHDRRRVMSDGAGTFDETLERIGEIRDLLDLRVRINVDAENVETLAELHSLLEARGLAESAYVAPVVGYRAPCHPEDSTLLSGPELGEALRGVLHFGTLDDIETRLTPSPLPCTALSASTFVFGPRGHVYRCWHDLDHAEQAIDHVIDGTGSPSRRLLWLTYDPLADPACAECSVLPLCLGGCPEVRLSGIAQPRCCSPMKTHIAAFVRRYAELIDRRDAR